MVLRALTSNLEDAGVALSARRLGFAPGHRTVPPLSLKTDRDCQKKPSTQFVFGWLRLVEMS